MRIGLVLPTPGVTVALPALLDEMARADELGFAAIWMPNIRAYDALTVLALAGQRTRRIELGTFVVPTYPQHPAVVAQHALTTQLATDGRLILGLGLSHPGVIESLGLDYSHPLRHMRAYLECLAPLLRQEATHCGNAEFQVAGYQLTVPGATPPPVMVAALGPRMLRLAGRRTSGTLIWMCGPRYLAENATPVISEAAAAAGRSAPRIVTSLPVCVTDREGAVRDQAGRFFARYGELPSYRAILDKEGASGPADVALIGDEATVRQRLDALAAAGATDFAAGVYTPEGEDGERTLALLRSYAGQR